MKEIRSNSYAVSGFASSIAAAAENMRSGNAAIAEDGVTNLAVNSESTTANQLIENAVSSIAAQISADAGRISSIAETFDEKDRSVTGKVEKI